MASPPVQAKTNPMTRHSAHVDSNKLARRLRRQVGRTIEAYHLIEEGDRIMVCHSGGKDSHTLLDILLRLQDKAPIRFEIHAVHLDQKQPGYPEGRLAEYLATRGIPFHIIERDTYSVVRRVIPEGKTQCGLCSRLRRGILYQFAATHGMTKIALGHHRDDIVETLFLNMFFGAKLKAMPVKLVSDDGRNTVIRPLAFCRERDIATYAAERGFPILPCTLCGSQENLQRLEIKKMLAGWERIQPGRVENCFRALTQAVPSHLLDTRWFDFAHLGAHTAPPARNAWLLPEAGGDAGAGGDPDAVADAVADADAGDPDAEADACAEAGLGRGDGEVGGDPRAGRVRTDAGSGEAVAVVAVGWSA
jgi:tRNA 2-thiocytidine biosynthesis protein TtcA